ncbi:PIN domain-containing protein [Fontibacter flavus]|uniref:PIN domain-containing protein n=1 Tax=Fontibacter flavus TaxID=654838 RepID=A0ABV6FR29_9BACT
MSRIAVDTNVLLYFLDTSMANRRDISADIILQNPFFNSQSLSEFVNVLNRRWKYPKEKIVEVLGKILEICQYVPLKQSTISIANELVRKYDFQIFDAFIVASALENDCEVLYTEDLQHLLLVENKLKIINPFL